MLPEVKKKFEFTGHAGAVYCLESGLSANTFLSGSGDRFVAEWNLEKLEPEKFSVKLEQSIYSLHHQKESHRLLIGDAAGSLYVLNLHEKKEERNIVLHRNGIFHIVSDFGKNIVVTAGADGRICVLRLSDFKLLLQLSLSSKKIRKLAFNSNAELLAVADGEGVIRIFETTFFNELHTFNAHENGVSSLAWHPSAPLLISGGKDAYLRFWRTDIIFSLEKEIPAHNFNIYQISFSPDAKYCATASRDKTVKLWDAMTFDFPLRLDKKSHAGHSNSVNCLLWSENGTQLISSGDDRKIIVWELL
jgi:WD40 repeat protein